MHPSRRMRLVDPPVIHVVRAEADRLRRSGARLLDLGQAVPWWRPAAPLLDATFALLDMRGHGAAYTPDPGLPDVRAALSRRLAERHGLALDPDRLVLTCGANQAYVNVCLALFDPGDEVLLPAPYYFNHKMALEMLGVVPVPVDGCGHRLDVAALEAALTPRTRGLTLVTPGNPLGTAYTAAELEAAQAFAAAHGLWVVSDETYMDLLFDGRPHASALHPPGAAERTVLLSSFSKSLALPGWRIGFHAAPESLHAALLKAQDTLAICAPHPAQLALLAGLPDLDRHLAGPLAELALRRDRLAAFCAGRGLDWIRPDGALFAMIKVTGGDSAAFCLDLLREAGVVAVPGGAFGSCADGHIRLSFGSTPRDTFTRALDALGAYLDRRTPAL